MPTFTRTSIAMLAKQMELKSSDPTRHKCFVSYHAEDADEAAAFLSSFGTAFIPRTLGITEEDDFIDSDDDDYIKSQISSKYMSDSTVTILLVGKCTWARTFVDWEIAATLRDSSINKRAGLLAYKLPSAKESQTIPVRLGDNYTHGEQSFASYYVYPSASKTVREHVQEAFDARAAKATLVNNSRDLRRSNAACA